MKKFCILSLAALGLSVPATAADQPNAELQALDDSLPGTLINDPTRLDWPVFGPGAVSKSVTGKDIPGGYAAIQITVPKKGATAFELGINAPITASIKSGTDIVVAFYARTISADTPDGKGRIGARVQMNAAPYSGFGDKTFEIGKEWALYEVSAKSNMAIPRGKAVVSFQLSGAKQVIEIGQTIVVSGAKSLTTSSAKPSQYATTEILPQLQGKGQLLNNPADKKWATYGVAGNASEVPAPNIPGTGGTALQMKTAKQTPNIYDVGASVPITGQINQGDSILVAILARTAPGGTADGTSKLGVRIQLNEAPYNGFGDNVLALAPTWRLLQFKTEALVTIPAGKGVVSLHFGAAAQAIEVGQVYILKTPPAAAPPAK